MLREQRVVDLGRTHLRDRVAEDEEDACRAGDVHGEDRVERIGRAACPKEILQRLAGQQRSLGTQIDRVQMLNTIP